MTRSFLLAAAVAFALPPMTALAEAPEGWSPLLEPAGLAALLAANGDDIRVVQITGDYAAGHIPGSGWSPYAAWRSDMPNPGALRDVDHLQAVVRELGIDADTPVVVVHSGRDATDLGAAARVYWTLKSLGVEDLALLNGGLAAWTAAALPVETAPASFFPSDFTAHWSDAWRSTTAEVATLQAEGGATLLDARPADFFDGITWSVASPGTIHGADNLAYSDFFDGTRLVGAERIRAVAAQAGLTDGTTTVSFCNTGHWAAINWFALSEVAGYDDVRLYAESMAEYTADDLPLDNAPNRLVYAYRATTRWVSGLF
ncbi:MAG: sulfurtransferase [Rhodobacter sp.]|nr:sulfurtransferase [Paracoccaceae bacterium]MCC0076823.1 sulfurtransferase [Rhodobacter sp.]